MTWNIVRASAIAVLAVLSAMNENSPTELSGKICEWLAPSPCPEFITALNVSVIFRWVLVALIIIIVLSWPVQWLINARRKSKATTQTKARPSELFAIAKAFRDEIVRGRVRTAAHRLARGDEAMMLDMISREGIHSPKLMAADSDGLSDDQAEALERYQNRERELDMCINDIAARRLEYKDRPRPPAIDFNNRLRRLAEALDRLIATLGLEPLEGRAIDTEIEQLMRDIGRIEEVMMGWHREGDIPEDIGDRFNRIHNSDHMIWHSETARQLRRDFINRCGILLHDRQNGLISHQDFLETKHEMRDFADRLLRELRTYRGR